MNQLNLNDIILKDFIDRIFDKYDTDRSGSLDKQQMTYFFNDLFKLLNINVNVTPQEALAAIRQMDQNGDGKADKKQLFDAFKVLLNKPKPQVQQNAPLSQSYPPPYIQGNQMYPYQPVNIPQNPYNMYNPYMNQPTQPYYGQQYNPYVQPIPQNVYNPYMTQPNVPYSGSYGHPNSIYPSQNQGMNTSYNARGSGWGKNI